MSAVAFVGVLLLFAALSSSRRLVQLRSSLWAVHLINSGYLFVFFGYLLGLTGAEAGPVPFHEELLPVLSMVTGWIGFSVGMAFHHRVLRPLPRRAFSVALLPAVVTFSVTSIVSLLILRGVFDLRLRGAVAAAVIIGAVASTTAPTLAAALRKRTRQTHQPLYRSLRMIEFSAGMDAGFALLTGLVGFALMEHGEGGLNALIWGGLTLGGGALVGLFAWLLLAAPRSVDERLLLGIGMIAFAAGLGSWLKLSPAVVGAVAGGVLVNLPGDRMTLLLRALNQVERPALVVLLTAVGYYSAGAAGSLMLILIPLLSVGRGGLKVWTARRFHGEISGFAGLRTEPGWGRGLLSQGHVGPVLALGLAFVWPHELSREILASVAIAGLLNEVMAPVALRRFAQSLQPKGQAGGPALWSTSELRRPNFKTMELTRAKVEAAKAAQQEASAQAAEDTPKTAEDSPKTAEDSPKTTEDSPKTAEDTPKTAEDTPKTAEDTPSSEAGGAAP